MTDKPELSLKIGNWFDAQAYTKSGVVALIVIFLVIGLVGGGIAQFTGALANVMHEATSGTPQTSKAAVSETAPEALPRPQ